MTGQRYEKACQEIFDYIQSELAALQSQFSQDLEDMKTELSRQPGFEKSTFEYDQIYGKYWLMCDSMTRINEDVQEDHQFKLHLK